MGDFEPSSLSELCVHFGSRLATTKRKRRSLEQELPDTRRVVIWELQVVMIMGRPASGLDQPSALVQAVWACSRLRYWFHVGGTLLTAKATQP